MHLLNIVLRHAKRLIFTIAATLIFSLSSSAFTLVLDPGHGGSDPGALGTYSKEKNINLNVVLKLKKLINKTFPEIKVICTRETDIFLKLSERAQIANKAKADLFISVHTNSAPTSGAVGTETFFLSDSRIPSNLDVVRRENAVIRLESNQMNYTNVGEISSIDQMKQSANMNKANLIADYIQSEYVKIGRPNKGVKRDVFYVLQKTAMPSVLTELGFISTPSEEAYLNSEKGITDLAQAIFNAFKLYYSPIMRDGTAPRPAPKTDKPANNTTTAKVAPQQKPKAQPQTKNNTTTTTKTQQPQKQQAQASAKKTTQPKAQVITTTSKQTINKPTPTAPTQKHSKSGLEYTFKIQLASSKRLKPESEYTTLFGKIRPIEYYTEYDNNNNATYKYVYGCYKTYKEVLAKIKELKSKGVIKDGMPVAYDTKDKRVNLETAKQKQP